MSDAFETGGYSTSPRYGGFKGRRTAEIKGYEWGYNVIMSCQMKKSGKTRTVTVSVPTQQDAGLAMAAFELEGRVISPQTPKEQSEASRRLNKAFVRNLNFLCDDPKKGRPEWAKV